MHVVLILLAVIIGLAVVWRLRSRSGDMLKIECRSCRATTDLVGPICPHCDEREEILVRQNVAAGEAGGMQVLLYHCSCNTRVILCDLKCKACGARISGDRRTELRPIEDPNRPERPPIRLAEALTIAIMPPMAADQQASPKRTHVC